MSSYCVTLDRMAALCRSLALLSLLGVLCLAQAGVNWKPMEILKTNLIKIQGSQERITEHSKTLVSNTSAMWFFIQHQIQAMREELEEFPVATSLVDSLQTYSDMSGRLLDQMMGLLQTQQQEKELLLEDYQMFLDFVDTLRRCEGAGVTSSSPALSQ